MEKVKFDDPKLKTQIQLKMAGVYRRLFQFTAAKDIYVEVLKTSNTMLNIQVEAAKLYQEWAALAKDEDKRALYLRAMGGSQEKEAGGKSIVWGWGRLFQTAAKYPQYRDAFHEARYNLALCRFNLSRIPTLKSEQQENLKKAKDNILQTQQLFGIGAEWEVWRVRYDALLKEIQKALGEKPLGLPEVKQPAAAPAGDDGCRGGQAGSRLAASPSLEATGQSAATLEAAGQSAASLEAAARNVISVLTAPRIA